MLKHIKVAAIATSIMAGVLILLLLGIKLGVIVTSFVYSHFGGHGVLGETFMVILCLVFISCFLISIGGK